MDHKVIWKAGDDMKAAVGPVQAMVQPLRQDWADPFGQNNVSLPDPGPVPGSEVAEKGALSGWRKYALILGAALVLGAASASSGGGGTKVEVTW